MSNETKRDVFNDLVEKYQNHIITVLGDYGNKDKAVEVWNERYDAALPDDLPVISEDVSNTMINYRFLWWKEFLDKAYGNELSGYDEINYKVRSESAEVACAWLEGVWRVEETGGIVKLEAEK
ncbi:hypothetical protein EFT87_12335 [Schleiferilactobacillus harbinensis]|uniref:hypothetical protein n=1 Tax=Schleiferilactobacillus harbinensis TaxID=304207 RepID=UPI0021A956EE|nr:hypothetical protein [Schleiferilactobacillus harbinensis]MCT2909439.1 hypothetical protein [Schleiferilactobacillus harbinensis]